MRKQKQRAIFLDRDGVINQVVVRGPDWIGSPRELHEWQWTEHIHEGVRKLHEAGYLLIVVTNQPEITRQQTTAAQLKTLHDHMQAGLPEIDDVFACIHDDTAQCDCRKPKPGMLLQAAREWDIDMENSWIVGDRAKDIEAGKAAGCKTCLIEHGYTYPCNPDLTCKNVLEFANTIIQ
jgi:D-glycero-D-manno-heptose 1,7-bisphosphate phosphatase